MSELKFKQSAYAGQVFMPEGAPRATLVYVAGFPYSLGDNTIIRWAISRGFAVTFPQAPGTYDSDGIFNASNYARLLQQTVEDVNQQKLKGARRDSPSIELPPAVGLVSHSFGTLAATRAFRELPELELLVMFAPLLGYADSQDLGVREDLSAQYDYVSHTRPHTFRLTSKDAFIADARRRLGTASRGSSTRVLAFAGGRDSDLNVSVLQSVFEGWVHDAFGPQSDANLHVIPSAGHSISSLLDSDAVEVLDRVARASM